MAPILYDLFRWPLDDAAASPRTAEILLWISFGVIVIIAGFFLVMRLAGRFRAGATRALVETAVLASGLSLGVLVWLERLQEEWLIYYLPLPAIVAGFALIECYWAGAGRRRRKTRIRTRYFMVELDYEAGIIDGRVLRGTYRRAMLSELSSEDLRLLLAEISSDPDSVNVLNAFLDHARAGAGRDRTAYENAGRQDEGRSRPDADSGMSEEEAWNLLGLARGASVEEIKAAYRRLMKQVHPDHGGTDYLAHKINQAKNLLLRA